MSTEDHILLADDRPLRTIADQIAAHTTMAVVREGPDRVVLARPAANRPGFVNAEVRANHLGSPTVEAEDLSLVDLLPVLVSVWYQGVDRDYQYSAAVNFFLELTGSATTTTVLLRGLDVLVAVFSPADGIVWMPPDTSPDAPDRERWLPYAPGTSS